MRLVLPLLLASCAAQAQVYKCEKDGQITFTDRPCHKDAKPLHLPPINTSGDAAYNHGVAEKYDERVRRESGKAGKTKKKDEKGRDDSPKARNESGVDKGMSLDEVRALLGSPDSVLKQPGDDFLVEIWAYKPTGGPQHTVTFKNGVVHSVTTRKGKKKR